MPFFGTERKKTTPVFDGSSWSKFLFEGLGWSREVLGVLMWSHMVFHGICGILGSYSGVKTNRSELKLSYIK